MELTDGQKRFFETFGYLHLGGLLADRIDWITAEFEAVWRDRGITHDGAQRSCIVPFIDQRESFCTLLDDPRIAAVVSGLLGEDANYLGGDGNYYTGDTGWHTDGIHQVGRYLKVALYLDPVERTSGCLRVIPGSHRITQPLSPWQTPAFYRQGLVELWDVEPQDVPCVALESVPGDVVAFNHNMMHASFGGDTQRRMFTLNFCASCESDAEITELKEFISVSARFWIDHMHSDVMRETASASRMRHLRQVMDHEGHLPALAARAREEQLEPSRG
jgi:hypothetical protein